MKRTFECLDCKKNFETDDNVGIVHCPHCQSENVQPATKHFPWKLCAGIVIGIACIAGIVLYLNHNSTPVENKTAEPLPVDTTEYVEEEDSALSVYLEEDKDLLSQLFTPPTVRIKGKPIYQNGGYTIETIVDNAPSNPYRIVILSHNDNTKKVMQSEDGKFDNIPFSPNDGLYDFIVVDKATEMPLCDPIVVAGFVEQSIADRRVTKEELQDLINLDDDDNPLYGTYKYISPDCK